MVGPVKQNKKINPGSLGHLFLKSNTFLTFQNTFLHPVYPHGLGLKKTFLYSMQIKWENSNFVYSVMIRWNKVWWQYMKEYNRKHEILPFREEIAKAVCYIFHVVKGQILHWSWARHCSQWRYLKETKGRVWPCAFVTSELKILKSEEKQRVWLTCSSQVNWKSLLRPWWFRKLSDSICWNVFRADALVKFINLAWIQMSHYIVSLCV